MAVWLYVHRVQVELNGGCRWEAACVQRGARDVAMLCKHRQQEGGWVDPESWRNKSQGSGYDCWLPDSRGEQGASGGGGFCASHVIHQMLYDAKQICMGVAVWVVAAVGGLAI